MIKFDENWWKPDISFSFGPITKTIQILAKEFDWNPEISTNSLDNLRNLNYTVLKSSEFDK